MLARNHTAEDVNDPVGVLRHFILAAPPGELSSVLQALRVLTGDDHFFFEVIPRLCVEHHLRHLTPFKLAAAYAGRHAGKLRCVDPKDAAGGAAFHLGREVFLTGRQNHLRTRIRHFAKLHHLQLREVEESVEGYFRHQRSLLIPRSTDMGSSDEDVDLCVFSDGVGCGSQLPRPEKQRERGDAPADVMSVDGFGTLNHVFFDVALQMHIEIDPVEERCVRVIPFGSTTTTSMMPEVLQEIEQQATGLHGGPLGHIRFVLQQEISRYVQACFGDERADSAAKGAECSAGGMAVLCSRAGDSGEECRSLVVAVAAVRQFPRHMWSGRWKSVFVVERAANSPTGAQAWIKGETQVHAHHREGGNIHLEIVRALGPTPLPEWPVDIFAAAGHAGRELPDTWELCAAAMAVIQRHEQRVHDAVMSASRNAGDEALRGLRRRLPITTQPFNFRRGAALPRPIFERPGHDD